MYVFWVPSRKYLSDWINRTGSSFFSILSHHILSLESLWIYYNSNQSLLYSLALVVWFLSTREMSSIKYWSTSVMTFLLSPYINLMLSCLKLAVVGYSFAAHLHALLDNKLKKGRWFISPHFKSLWWFPPIFTKFWRLCSVQHDYLIWIIIFPFLSKWKFISHQKKFSLMVVLVLNTTCPPA